MECRLTRGWRLFRVFGFLSLRRLFGLASSASAPATGALALRAVFAVPGVAAAVTAIPPTTVVTVAVAPAPSEPTPPRAADDPVYETPDHEHFDKSATSQADPEGGDALGVPTQCVDQHPRCSGVLVAIDVYVCSDEEVTGFVSLPAVKEKRPAGAPRFGSPCVGRERLPILPCAPSLSL